MDSCVEVVQTGSKIYFGGLDENQRVEKILGNEYSTILLNEVSQIPYSTILIVRTRLAQRVRNNATGQWLPIRAYYDLNPTGRRHWSHQEFVEHRSPVTAKPLDRPQNFRWMQLNPVDNAQNLSESILDEYRALPDRQYKRFYLGEYSTEIDGALWTFETIERARCLPEEVPEYLSRVVIAIDPSGTAGEEETRSDEVGMVVLGKDENGIGYVLEDLTCQLPPEGWGRLAVEAYLRRRADRIVAERNYGGDMVRAVIDTAARAMGIVLPPVSLETVSRGKHLRAEPVSVLYGFERDGEWQGDQVRHAGEFFKLEEELLNFSTAGYMGPKSPNRADALVLGFSDLMLGEKPPGWSRSRLEVVG